MSFGDLAALLPGAGSAPPSLRRPVLALKFTPGAPAGAGGLGGLAGAAAGGLGGAVSAAGAALGLPVPGAGDPWAEHVVSVSIEAGLAPGVDAAVVTVAGGPGAPPVAVGDAGTLSLGYEDGAPVPVFSGTVDAVRRDLEGTLRVVVTNAGARLARLRLNQPYEQRAAGDVALDLAGRVGAGTGAVEDGIRFPYLVLDDRTSAYAHLAALAKWCGLLAFVAADGKLQFKAAAGGTAVQTFVYGADILALEGCEAAPAVGAVTTWGEGAAGSHGQAAWSWLVKDPAPVRGTAGTGEPARAVVAGALRSAAAARATAQGISGAAGALKTSGWLRTAGAPVVSVGSTIEISGAPQAELNGQFLVRGVRHRYHKEEGFTTRILFSKTAAAGGGGGDLLGALAGAAGGLL